MTLTQANSMRNHRQSIRARLPNEVKRTLHRILSGDEELKSAASEEEDEEIPQEEWD
jgi:hypothetical protein